MTGEEYMAILQILTAIYQELKKANQRPLYIVVNDEKAMRELARQLSEDRLLSTDEGGDSDGH